MNSRGASRVREAGAAVSGGNVFDKWISQRVLFFEPRVRHTLCRKVCLLLSPSEANVPFSV
jgi:hypothetical protein